MNHKLFLLIAVLTFGLHTYAQDSYLNSTSNDDEKTYTGGNSYDVQTFTQTFKVKKPKNVILMIGDGMGVAQVFSGLTANKGHLYLENFKNIGFSKTQSADNYITDSAAGGTALSCGVKTYNGAIGVTPDKKPVKTILEKAEEKNLATGLVATSTITHATPASFIAHQPNRNMYEEIAADFLKTDIEVFIGGGYTHFASRKDGRNLVNELEEKGYTVKRNMDEISKINSGKLVGLVADSDAGRLEKRGNMLPAATKTAIDILDDNKKGFFLMVEGSQIDWGGHAGNTNYVVEDMIDFDQAIGKALEFASKNGETLIVVTADHETGGMSVVDGDMKTGMVKGAYTTGSHSAVWVPVFAYGPGAEEFRGIMENTEVNQKMTKLLLGK